MNSLPELVESLCKDLNINLLQKNSQGKYALAFEDTFIVTLTEVPPQKAIRLETVLCPIPPESEGESKMRIYQTLATTGLFGKDTQGAAFGLDEEEKHLFIIQRLPYPMSYEFFAQKLETFCNFADYWIEETKRYLKPKHADVN